MQDKQCRRGVKKARRADGARRKVKEEEEEDEAEDEEEEARGRRLTRVCLYLRAFLSDASAAIDTLSLTQK